MVHSTSDFRDVLIDLQKRGVVFYCNRLDNGCYVVPEEIVAGVKDALGIEMTRVGWEKLLDTLTGGQLGAILEDAGLPSGPIPKSGEHRERGCVPSGKARRRRHSGAIPRRRNAAGGAQARSNAIDISETVHEDLLWVAETWRSKSNGQTFNPEAFNITGVLDRTALEGRMRLFL